MTVEHEIANRYSCAKCQNREVYIKRIATTGTGLSRIFDIEHNVFIACSCARCSYTEFITRKFWREKTIWGPSLIYYLADNQIFAYNPTIYS
ncbi:zinc ribbon domain-containing protein [Larkinella humicola]|uniref:zinc ribbon domain-containing protein n=1 Tax=Larkinella humicola TaxID=2607654 RepID=UPI001CD9B89D